MTAFSPLADPLEAVPQPLYRRVLALLAAVTLALVLLAQLYVVHSGANSATLIEKSTLGALGNWMAEQGQTPAPESLLGSFAKSINLGVDGAYAGAHNSLLLWQVLLVVLAGFGVVGLLLKRDWWWHALLTALIGVDVLFFLIPVLPNNPAIFYTIAAVLALAAVLLLTPGAVHKFVGVLVIFSLLLAAWEGFKAFSVAQNYAITVPQSAWTYQSYATLDEALTAVQNGQAVAAIMDNKTVRDSVPEQGANPAGLAYPELRRLSALDTTQSVLGLPVRPEFPGRLTVIVPANTAGNWQNIAQLVGQPIATVQGDFAEEKYLPQTRSWVLLDLRIGNDLNMPHLQSIAEALLQPARRQGPVLLLRILSASALYTWGEALFGFVTGALLGFLLGTLFAHSRLMERGLLPYVVASQTVPILAIAPMVVIWLGAGPLSVAMISAYLTFFPVTINTLRGLTSPQPTALELLRSYAATPWTAMWKLRFPAALPYIFTALKVSATSSVVGAVIGELPSGIRDGLGGAILNFNQYYASDPAKLWAAILIAAVVGIVFYVLVALLEAFVLRGKVQEA